MPVPHSNPRYEPGYSKHPKHEDVKNQIRIAPLGSGAGAGAAVVAAATMTAALAAAACLISRTESCLPKLASRSRMIPTATSISSSCSWYRFVHTRASRKCLRSRRPRWMRWMFRAALFNSSFRAASVDKDGYSFKTLFNSFEFIRYLLSF